MLIENLRRTAERPEEEPELTLFDSFDGLDDLQQIEFYEHDANWSNRMILGDSLQVMASLAEREKLRGKVQMVYIDPPYGIKFGSNWQVSARNRDVTDGKMDDAAREAEQIKAFRDTWELGIHSYLSYLRDRLLAARDLLDRFGSCFVQIGDENVHLVRALMDEVFGPENFVAQIDFPRRTGSRASRDFWRRPTTTSSGTPRTATAEVPTAVTQKAADGAGGVHYTRVDQTVTSTMQRAVALPTDAVRRAAPPTATRTSSRSTLTSSGDTATGTFPVRVQMGRRSCVPTASTLEDHRRRNGATGRGRTRSPSSARRLTYVRYLDDFPAFQMDELCGRTRPRQLSDDKVYVVQTHAKVIERCMLMCTDPG